MPLHLVGENIDKMRAHRQAEAGKLVQLMRGIYVNANDDIDQTVRTHAVRIAKETASRKAARIFSMSSNCVAWRVLRSIAAEGLRVVAQRL